MNSAQSPHIPEEELLAYIMLQSTKSNTVLKLATPEVQLGHVVVNVSKET